MASTNQKLQTWLLEIENGLGDRTPGERAKIILDFEARAGAQLTGDDARDDQTIDSVLASIGTPAQVLETLRRDRGWTVAPPTRASSSSGKFWKWATLILVGGFFSLIALCIVVPLLLFKFVAGSGFSHSMNFTTFGPNASSYHLKGSQTAGGLEHLILRAANGRINVTSGSNSFSYDCTMKGDAVDGESPLTYPDAATVVFNFDELSENSGSDCTIEVPKDTGIDITLADGSVELSNMRKDVKVRIENGRLKFAKDPGVVYEVSASASTGQINGLDALNRAQSAMKADAPRARADLKVTTGPIDIL